MANESKPLFRVTLDPGTPVSQAGIIPADPALLVSGLCDNAGNPDLVVDGSTTAQTFTFGADPAKDLYVNEVRLVLTTLNLTFDGNSFGNQMALGNGCLVEITADNGKTGVLGNIKINEDLLKFATPSMGLPVAQNGDFDVIMVSRTLSGAMILRAGTSDNIKVTIRDDIVFAGNNAIKYFRCMVNAVKAA